MTAMTTATTVRTLQAENRAQWRAWLADNCVTADEGWLVIQHANGATRSVSHRDAVEEALCFGGSTAWHAGATPSHCGSASPHAPHAAPGATSTGSSWTA